MYWSIHAYTRVERFKVIVRSGRVLVVTQLFNIAVNYFNPRKTPRYRRILVITELFDITVNDFDAENASYYSRVFIVSELFVNGTRCIFI